jgi:hypothetical protein
LKIFLEEMNFLGKMIKAGRIFPSSHQKLKALDSSPNTVRTVSDLRSFLGLCQFLARFMHRSTDIFSNLRKWLGKDGKMEIPWDDNEGFLRKEFGKVLRALQELTHLRLFDVAKQAYILKDTLCVYVVDEDKHTVEFRRPADAFEGTCAVIRKAKGIRRDVTCSSISGEKDDYMAS